MISICVITLAKNSESVIHETLESVSLQSYKSIYHLLVYGDSNDQTLDIIKSYKSLKKMFIVFQSGKGIANGFNLGIDNSSEEIIIFLNAGDIFVDVDVVQNVVDSYSKYSWDWAFGEKISTSKNKSLKRHTKQYDKWSEDLLFWRNPICHQSTFFSKKFVESIGYYDESLSIGMDYDYNIRASKVTPPHLLYFPIAYYDTTGLSSRKVFESFFLARTIRDKYFSLAPQKRLFLDIIGFFKATLRFIMIPFKTLF